MSRTSPIWTIVNDFHIEKARLSVEVVTDQGERVSGDMFVVWNTASGTGHEEVPDVLNAADPFFPLGTRDGRTLLCAKSRVRAVIVASDAVRAPAWEHGTRADVAIEVSGGDMYTGSIFIEQTSANQRVLDFLNRVHSRFIQVASAEGVVLINRDAIVHVEHLA